MSWFVHRNIALEHDLHRGIAIELAYSVRFLFKDLEVVFESGVDVVPVVDEGESSATSTWGVRREVEGATGANELEDVLKGGDFATERGGSALGIFDSEDEVGEIHL